jgi:hypothetical protein
VASAGGWWNIKCRSLRPIEINAEHDAGGGGGPKVYSLWEWPTDLGLRTHFLNSEYDP